MMFERLLGRRAGRVGETKASAAGPLVSLHVQGRPRWSPRDYGAMARQGFMVNPVVHRAVRMIAEAAAGAPLLLFENGRAVDQHPLLDLIAAPNPAQGGASLMEAAFAGLLISGNAYVEAVRLDGVVRELFVLRPDRVRVVPGADGWPSAFVYAAGGREVTLPRADVMHLKLFHPVDDHYGLSPLEAAAQAVDLHNQMAAWNKALLDNAARPSGALVYRGGHGASLSDEQFDRLRAELDEQRSGPRGAGRPMLLEGGLDWTPMSLTPQEMDFDTGRNAAARDIAMAFGVPPMLLGIPGDATYANYQAANLAFWRQTVLPLARRMAAGLSAFLGPAFGVGLKLEVDVDGIEALVPERTALWAALEAASFLTRDEKRAAVGYGPG